MGNEWIYWDGGECPVDINVLVDVEYRDGLILEKYPGVDWIWDKFGMEDDIVAYRLSEVK